VTERICSRLDPNKFLWKIGGDGLGSTVKDVLAMGEQVAMEAVVAEELLKAASAALCVCCRCVERCLSLSVLKTDEKYFLGNDTAMPPLGLHSCAAVAVGFN